MDLYKNFLENIEKFIDPTGRMHISEVINDNYNNIIVVLSVVAVSLLIYRILISKENFNQVDICDYNSPNPDDFCKSIQKGCAELIYENQNLNINMQNNCTTLPTDTKDVINTAIVCDDTANKLIMNNYVQKEVCSQIKNFPETVPPIEVLTPSTNLLLQESVLYEPVQPEPSYKPLDYIENTKYSPF